MINEMTLAPVLADLRDKYKSMSGDYMRGYADGINRALNVLMMWRYHQDSQPEVIPKEGEA